MPSTRAGKRRFSRAGRRAAVAGLLAALAPAAWGQVPAAAGADGPVVRRVEIRSDAPVGRARALVDLVEVDLGEPLSGEAVRASLRNLQATGEAGQIEVWRFATDRGLRVVFALTTRYQVTEVELAGRLGLRAAELERVLDQRAGEPLAESRVVRGVYRLQEALAAQGFLDAVVRVEVDTDDAARQARVVYRIEAGAPAEISRLRFDGTVEPLTAEALAARLPIATGERYRSQAARAAAERLEEWLVAEGYRQARVERPRELHEPGSARVELVYPIEVGPRIEVEVSGADRAALTKRGLMPLLEERFDEALLLQTVDGLVRHYQERGHYRVEVEVERVEEPGVLRLLFTIAPGPELPLRRFELAGHETFSEERLAALMATSERRLLARGSGRLVDEVLASDLDNLRSFYALEGFGQVEVGPAEISESGGTLEVVIPIVEGPRRRVVEIDLRGELTQPRELLLGQLALAPGGPYHPRRLEESIGRLAAFYEERGHEYAQIEAALDWNEERTLVDVTLKILEGPRSLVDRVILRGNQRTRPGVVQRSIELAPGDPVNTRRLLETQRSLYSLGIFSRVEVELAPAAPFSGRRDVLVRVDEARRHRVSYGVGYDSDDGVRGLLGYGRQNLWGRAVTARADLRASQRDSLFRALLQQPYLGRFKLPVTLSLALVEEMEESFESSRRALQLEIERPRRRLDLGLVYTYKIVEVRDLDPALREIEIRRDLREVEIASVAPRLLVDRRDDPLTPRRGWSASLVGEYAFPAFAADTQFFKLFGQATAYLDLGRFGVLAGSVRGGAIEPLGSGVLADPTLPPGLPSAEIPISERFFAGGRSSHRAYRRDRLAIPGETALRVQDEIAPEGLGRLVPVGGNGLLLVNLDVRFPIAGPVGGTVFADFGNVWADWRGVDPGEGKTGVGVGLRYLSPIGPLRLEVGWKLDREPDESPAALFLSFGYPF